MSESIQQVISDGTLVSLDVSIPYIDQEDMFFYVDEVLAAPTYTVVWVTATQISISPAIPLGAEFTVRRRTKSAEALHVFGVGNAVFSDVAVDENFRQVLYIAQEAKEGASATEYFSNIDMHGNRITNAGDAVDPQDYVTKSQADTLYAAPLLAGTRNTETYTATASQTVITTTFSYIPNVNTIAVVVNGLTLVPASDYTETNGNTVTLLNPLDAGDSVVVEFFGSTISSVGSENVGFLQAGTGAVARTSQSKLRESVSVKDFGAVGDGLVDDTAAIQAAIDSVYSKGGGVYFPNGTYKTTATLKVKRSYVTLSGAGRGASRILITGDYIGIKFENPDLVNGGYAQLFHCALTDITLDHSTGITVSCALNLRQSRVFILNNVVILKHQRSIYIEGGQAGEFSNFACSNYDNNSARVNNTGMIEITSLLDTTPAYQNSWTYNFTNFFLGCGNAAGKDQCYSGLYLRSGDANNFSNFYIAEPYWSNVFLNPDPNTYLAAINFSNGYLDGNAYKAFYGVTSANTVEQFSAISFNNIVFNSHVASVFLEQGLRDITFNSCSFLYAQGRAVAYNGPYQASPTRAQYRRLSITNCSFIGCGANAGASVLYFRNLNGVVASGNNFNTATGVGSYAIELTGSLGDVALTGNLQYATAGLIFNNSAVISKLTNTGGIITYDPLLTLGGASTGITYSLKQGSYSIAGGVVTVSVYFTLSSKGSATGDILIQLPKPPATEQLGQSLSIQIGNAATPVNDGHLIASVGNTGITLRKGAGTTYTTLTDADLTATTTITITGQYVAYRG
jgi:hypothetical protein